MNLKLCLLKVLQTFRVILWIPTALQFFCFDNTLKTWVSLMCLKVNFSFVSVIFFVGQISVCSISTASSSPYVYKKVKICCLTFKEDCVDNCTCFIALKKAIHTHPLHAYRRIDVSEGGVNGTEAKRNSRWVNIFFFWYFDY